jgi:DNA-binding NarL/FixJ family response regulator
VSTLRLLVADDHDAVRAALCNVLRSFDRMRVVAEATDGLQALRLIEEHAPDVAIVDIAMPRLNGLELAGRIARDHPRTHVVIFSFHSDTSYVHAALQAGAAGYLLKNTGMAEMEQALRAVGRGERWVSSGVPGAGVCTERNGM